jgi:hypothetical protein
VSGGSLRKHLYILSVTAICYENRSERLPSGSNRDKKRKRKLPESRYPRFRASDVTHIESGNPCAASIRAFEVHIRSDTLDILRMSAVETTIYQIKAGGGQRNPVSAADQ